MNDDDLLNRQFWTKDPLKLDGLIDHLPTSSEIPIIEYQYDLRQSDPEKSTFVKCVHCKVSQPNHSKGFVLKLPSTGERFLIGHHCGKKHYSANFEQVSRDFTEQMKRSLQLGRLKRVQAGFAEFLEYLDTLVESELFTIYDDLHIGLIDKFPDLQRYLAQSSGELTIPKQIRDIAREEREASNYEDEKEEWDNLTTTEQKRRRREGIRPPKPKKYYVTQNLVVGRFSGQEFVVRQQPIKDELALISDHLKSAYVELDEVQTHSLTTQQLRSKLNGIEALTNNIRGLINKTNAMNAFFQPANLKAIANWANQYPEFKESYSASGKSLVCEDNRYGGQKYVIAFSSQTIEPLDLAGLDEFIEISRLGTD
ncbi:hypothetical protein AUQ41_08330 [Thalassospira sp. MCCC 1A02898]|nr:hypothetical protein AUQ41_08330 [Thalassospira sp. MCCC 1A02898]